MKTIFVAILFFTIMVNACASRAEDRIYLYGDYYYGMSEEEFLNTGPAQCESHAGDIKMCARENALFADLEWGQLFVFKDSGLTSLAFTNPLSLGVIDAALIWFQAEDFSPIMAKAGANSVNFLLLYDKNRKPEFEGEKEQFNSAVPSEDDMTAYLLKIPKGSGSQAMDKLPEGAIMATMGGSKSANLFYVSFQPAKNFICLP